LVFEGSYPFKGRALIRGYNHFEKRTHRVDFSSEAPGGENFIKKILFKDPLIAYPIPCYKAPRLPCEGVIP